MELQNRKILVIGGSGFVGSRLISVLDPSICANLDKEKSPFYSEITTIGNIVNNEEIRIAKGITDVVLLAAEHRDDVSPTSLYYDVNVEGTKNVLKAMDEAGIKSLIFTSSVAIYGLNKDNPNESHTPDPFNHYGRSKWQAEVIIKKWYDDDSINKSVTIIRPTVIFGERNRGNVYNLFKQISSGKFVMIGPGHNKKSMAYVGNVVAFIKHRLEESTKGYSVYNYADKPDLSMNELSELIINKMKLNIVRLKIPFWLGMFCGFILDLIAFLTKTKFALSSVRIKKFCATTQFDASKVHIEFNAPYMLRKGLDKTLEYEFLNEAYDDVLFQVNSDRNDE